MGLWLERTAPTWSGEEILDRVTAAVMDALPDPTWRELVEVDREGPVLGLGLHPAEERVRCAVDGDRLTVSARTNSAGPGYHAFLVDLLDRVADLCGFEWDPPEDLSGFVAMRDFQALQAEACEWLGGVVAGVTARLREGMTSLGVSLPEGTLVVGEERVASPLGLWSREWFEEAFALDAEGEAFAARARAFFPWFDAPLDASVWARAGLAIAWIELPWRAPRDPAEERRYRQALTCFARARALDPAATAAALPDGLEAEVRRLLEARGKPLEAPAADGIGLRRRTLRWPLAGGWTLDLPGYFTSTVERDGQTEVIWFPGRTVRVSTITARDRHGNPPPADELLRTGAGSAAEPGLTFTRGHLSGQATLVAEEEDGAPFFTLQGGVAAPGELCVVTISFSNPADEEWALETWASAFHPGPAEE